MTIFELASKSSDSVLLDYEFKDGVLRVLLDVPDLDNAVCVSAPTSAVRALTSGDRSAPDRTCFIELLQISDRLQVNENGIFVPAGEFPTFMDEMRAGYHLAYGLRVREWPYLLSFSAASPLLVCIVRDPVAITCSVAT